MKGIHIAAFLLLLVGAVNWGLWGLFRLNLVENLLSPIPGAVMFIYILVGISGVYIGITHVKDCKICFERGNKRVKN